MEPSSLDVVRATVDFYLLESLVAEMPHQNYGKVNPKISSELARAIRNEHNRLSEQFASALYDYLFLAAVGEARNAARCAEQHYSELPTSSRSGAYHYAFRYNPSENWDKLIDLFSVDWSIGYGGDAWKRICEAAKMRDELTPAAFVDHVIDLAHNGGCAFDKDVSGTVRIKTLYSYDARCSNRYTFFTQFLDYKFCARSLALEDLSEDTTIGTYLNVMASYRTVELVNRFCTVFRLTVPNWARLNPNSDIVQEYSAVNWGDLVLDELEYSLRERCESCGCSVSEDEGCYTDDGCYCESCFSDYYTYCHKCGETTSNDDAIEINGEFYCEYCADKVGFKCDKCDNWVKNDDGDGEYCDTCKENMIYCDKCEEWEDAEDSIQLEDGTCVCANCRKEQCSKCFTWHLPEDMSKDDAGEWYCGNCAIGCNSCGIALTIDDRKHFIRWVYGASLGIHAPMVARMQNHHAIWCDKCAVDIGMKGQLAL